MRGLTGVKKALARGRRLDVPNHEFFGHYADALGVRMRTVPAAVARRLAGVIDRLDRAGTGDVNPRAVDYMLRTGTYSIAKAARVLGWVPTVAPAEGMAHAGLAGARRAWSSRA